MNGKWHVVCGYSFRQLASLRIPFLIAEPSAEWLAVFGGERTSKIQDSFRQLASLRIPFLIAAPSAEWLAVFGGERASKIQDFAAATG